LGSEKQVAAAAAAAELLNFKDLRTETGLLQQKYRVEQPRAMASI